MRLPHGQRRNGTTYRTRCGHDRARPRLGTHDALPPRLHFVLRQLVNLSERIFHHSREFPELQIHDSDRVRRSDRREAIVRVVKVLFVGMDLASWRVGRPVKGAAWFEGLSVAEIASRSGLNLSRVEEALHDLARAGLMHTTPDARGRLCAPQARDRSVDPGTGELTFAGLPAVRRFTPRLFERLGYLDQMREASRQAAERAREAEREREAERAREQAAELRRVSGRLAASKGAAAPSGRRGWQQDRSDAQVAAENQARNFNRAALELRIAHPDWTADEVRAAARRVFPPPE